MNDDVSAQSPELLDDEREEEHKHQGVELDAGDFDGVGLVPHRDKDGHDVVPLWLITFTDVMALMLTFFVLLYSMSIIQEEKWEEISESLSSKLHVVAPQYYEVGTQDVIDIDKIVRSRALDLNYLQVLVGNLMAKNERADDIVMFQHNNRLVLSLPSELLFKPGQADINLDGKKLLFSLGGALSRVRNRIEIVGHTDPSPIEGGRDRTYQSNWELSLARSSAVAVMLREVGYTKPMTIRGFSHGRYDEMSRDVPEDVRYDLSRRVDIVLMEDDDTDVKFNRAQ